jgi:hypothetical protein
MSLRLRALRLSSRTELTNYSRTIELADGLNVIRSANTTGKSTLLNSILWALALERMVTAKATVPLPHAVTEYLIWDKERRPVVESDVTLRIENGRGEQMVIRRVIASKTRQTKLIEVWNGTVVLPSADDVPHQSFYARDPGAAQRDAGFHRRLAEFVGWTLPSVARFDGPPILLYMETLAPLFFIEQKRGWLGIHRRISNFFGIREVHQRAIEFLLDLDMLRGGERRTQVEEEYQRAISAWREAVATLTAVANAIDGRIVRPPTSPTDPVDPYTALDVIVDGGDWVDIDDLIADARDRLKQMQLDGVPTTEQHLAQSVLDLESEEQGLERLEARRADVEARLEGTALDLNAAKARSEALIADLERNKDERKLRKLGSLAQLVAVAERCPTCGQRLSGQLLANVQIMPMGVDQNIEFLEEMIGTVTAAISEARESHTRLSQELRGLDALRAESRARIRMIKRALVQDDRLPSVQVIEERMKLEALLRDWTKSARQFRAGLKALRDAQKRVVDTAAELESLKLRRASAEDEAKLTTFVRSFVAQLREYGFQSVEFDRIFLDKDYRPTVADLGDLEFELSGSDLIRAIFAYFMAMLETARTHQTNHPGFLIIDEPKQQGTEAASIAQMLRRATDAAVHGQQIIVASSEHAATLQAELGGLPFNLIDVSPWVLKPT